VGFIRKLPHHLVASFRATLEEAADADLLLHVADASHPAVEEQVSVADRVLADLGLGAKRTLYVFNKMDRVSAPRDFLAGAAARYPWVVGTSATAGDGEAWSGVTALRAALQEAAREQRAVARIAVPLADGALLAALHREGEVLAEVQENGVMVVTARVRPELLGRLRRWGVEVVVGGEEEDVHPAP